MKKTLVIAGILCALALTGCRTKFDTRALDALTSLSQITPAEIGVAQMAVADSISLNGKSASVDTPGAALLQHHLRQTQSKA